MHCSQITYHLRWFSFHICHMHSCSESVEVRDVEHDLESAIVDNVQLSLQWSLKVISCTTDERKGDFLEEELEEPLLFYFQSSSQYSIRSYIFFLPAFSLIHGFLDSVCCIISMSLSLTWLRQWSRNEKAIIL